MLVRTEVSTLRGPWQTGRATFGGYGVFLLSFLDKRSLRTPKSSVSRPSGGSAQAVPRKIPPDRTKRTPLARKDRDSEV
ncbi:unnamed protein product [Lasius platythorax]|uniref:Uncharacterized protein n=1 Tax=Lasius platythorax TaxID=488582 RepID=A0AAV2MVI7_9HYME